MGSSRMSPREVRASPTGGFCPAQGVLGLFQLLRSRKCALSPVVKACQCPIRLGECLFHIRKAGIAQFWSLKSAGGSRKAFMRGNFHGLRGFAFSAAGCGGAWVLNLEFCGDKNTRAMHLCKGRFFLNMQVFYAPKMCRFMGFLY